MIKFILNKIFFKNQTELEKLNYFGKNFALHVFQ